MAENDNHGRQCKYQAYQSREEPALVFKLECDKKLPFSLISPAELKITLKKMNYEEDVVLTMKLKSSTCENIVLLPLRYKNADVVFHLKYQSLFWISVTKEFTLENAHTNVSFRLRYMMGIWNANFCIKTEERNKIMHEAPWLCREELTFLESRKTAVYKNLCALEGIEPLNLDEVPNIAIIGSGGGMRAVIGMGSAMDQLKESKILDCAMHVSGVSGSAWYLLALYAHEVVDPEKVNCHIREKLGSFSGVMIWMAWYLWKYYKKGIQFEHGQFTSFTNIFGEMIGHLLLKQSQQKWSEQKAKLTDGNHPLPLIAALHGRHDKDMEDHDWVEFSPYQVYMPRYGIAIPMAEFGDVFETGFCKRKYKEPPIHFLQGIVGSAYASLRYYRLPGYTLYSKVCAIKDYGLSILNRFEATFIGTVPNFLRGRRINSLSYQGAPDVHYKAGKTKDSFHAPGMMLIDAGLACNSPYPLVLHPSRQVDIIISFDFSNRDVDDNWPFKHLLKAERWAKEKNVCFPEIENKLKALNIREEHPRSDYEEVYIFEGLNSPTIVHFVLINRSFKIDDAARNFRIFPDYGTFRFYYANEEFDRLKLLVRHNIIVNKEKIIGCLNKKIKQKQSDTHRK